MASELIVDTFTESSDTALSSHTPDSGAASGWGGDATLCTVLAATDVVESTGTKRPNVVVTPSTADYEIITIVNLADSATSNRVGPRLRHASGSVAYEFRLYGSGLWRMYRFDGITNPTLSTATLSGFDATADTTITFWVEGTGATVTLNCTVDNPGGSGSTQPVTDYEDTDTDRLVAIDDPALYLEGGNETATYFEAGYLSTPIVTKVLTESISVNEPSLLVQSYLTREALDYILISDQLVDKLFISRLLADVLDVGDALDKYFTKIRYLSSYLDTNDSIIASVSGIIITTRQLLSSIVINEPALIGVNLLTRSLTESITVTDLAALRHRVLARIEQSSFDVTDSKVRLLNITRQLFDNLDVADILLSQVLSGLVTFKTLSDSLDITDAQINNKAYTRQLLSSMGITDDLTVSLIQSLITTRSLSDSINAADFIVKEFSLIRVLAETLDANDSITSNVYALQQAIGFILAEIKRTNIKTGIGDE